MSRVRDIAAFLGLTEANNTTNAVLTSAEDPAGLDSAATVALITGGNAITVTSGVVDHDDTSAQASVNNSGSNFIQDIYLDTYGHVTAITSAAASGGVPAVSVQTANPWSVVIGQSAANSNTGTQGFGSVHIGYQAGYQPSDQHAYAVMIGHRAGAQAGTSDESVFIGNNAGNYINRSQTGGQYTATNNIAIGKYALANSSSDRQALLYNLAIGNNAGKSLYSNCFENVIIGHEAMSVTGGSGTRRMQYGNYNTAIGSYAGYNLSHSSSNNTLIGRQAGYALASAGTQAQYNTVVGAEALNSATTADGNAVFGKDAAQKITTGTYNTCIGYLANVNAATDTFSVTLGAYITGKGSHTTNIKGPAYQSSNSSTWYTTSDERIKTNVTDYTTGLTLLDQVNVKTYNYLSDSDIATAHPELADSDGLVHEGLDTTKTIVGIMAQELETVLPNSVTTRDNGIKSVNKDELFWVMLNSIKELSTKYNNLDSDHNSLITRLEALENA